MAAGQIGSFAAAVGMGFTRCASFRMIWTKTHPLRLSLDDRGPRWRFFSNQSIDLVNFVSHE
jgi:hypothetical protein